MGKTGRIWMVLLAVPGEVGVGYPGESKVVLLPENNKQTKTTKRHPLEVSTRTPNSCYSQRMKNSKILQKMRSYFHGSDDLLGFLI